ncbi:MAG: hypothetical protein WA843_00225 [Candidatus Saccharimonadales bacterium]
MNKLRRCVVIVLSMTALFLIGSNGVARAHVLKQDNGISGVLHIPPEDNPEAGQPTTLEVSFGDAKNAFSLQHCDCRALVKNNGQLVRTAALRPALAGATLNATTSVQFPVIGVYDVIVEGVPKDGTFHAFQLDYLVRVVGGTPSDASGSTGSSVVIVGVGSLIVLCMVAYSAIQRGGRYTLSDSKRRKQR